jgi:predicted Zn-dependent protease
MALKARLAGAVAAALALSSCGGGADGDSVSDEDRRLGAEQHPQLLAEFGGAYRGDEAAYVAQVGNRLAEAAGLQGRCTFTLVNSDVVNAFAVPGCYIYVTRGLLAIVNSEAELAAVLGHELGHIAGRHSAQQQKRSVWRSLGVMAIGAITGSDALTQLAGTAATFFTLRYSRKHEHEADDLGLEYLHAAGYDPYETMDMLGALERHQAYQQRTRGDDAARSIPQWALTHPLTENRIERVRGEVHKLAVKPDELPEHAERYLRTVDGLLYGDDPEQGFVIGRRFAHPVMRIGFEAPPGFTLTNSPQAIMIDGPDGVRGLFAGGPVPPGGLAAYAEAVLAAHLGQAPVQIVESAQGRSNGGPALIVSAEVGTEQGAVPISLAVYGAADGGAYHFLVVSSPGVQVAPAVAALMRSFRFLTPAEIATLAPRRIRVIRAQAGQTAAQLASGSIADAPLDHFLMLNGLESGASVRPGQLVKRVEWAR